MTTLHVSNFKVRELQPVSFTVNNELVCLSGPSGTGKSLLLRAIADLIVHQGEVFLNDKTCSDTHPVMWRQWVGLLPAESSWWLDKVGDHFKQIDHEYLNALNLPAESLEWEVSRCSTGEKQRLAIVRLLEQQPKVLLLDEPTASLDADSVNRVESVIQDYANKFNVPVIWVSHDNQQIKRLARRAFKIENNEISEVTV
ncbi:MAG: ATP-binding cassette domain-containing protein [Gammaproteobacteria bacterium]|nr:ATP-binding cassette domain-containing protein [Gammaproteobacteria bacterium]